MNAVNPYATSRRRRWWDWVASLLINASGLGVVALVLLILWYLLSVALPLAEPTRIGRPVAVESEGMPSTSASLYPDGDGLLRISDHSGGRYYQLDREGGYSCSESSSPVMLPQRPAQPLRGASLTENGDALLVLDGIGTLFRFAVAPPGQCQLRAIGEPQPQPFVATTLLSEYERPVAVLIDGQSTRLRILATITGELLFDGALPDAQDVHSHALAEDGTFLLGQRGDQLLRWPLQNRYPQAGMAALWKRVWYPGYDREQFVWHPGGEGVGSLSKYSLTPLLYGTFKAALYGMLIAVPLALGAAIYTGYFMSQGMRNRFKPTLELLEAFPTVVLGFVAGVWLAPLLSDYLLFVLLTPVLLLGLPLLLAVAYGLLQRIWPGIWARPPRLWLLAVTYLGALGLLAVLGPELERSVFGGALRDWLLESLGLRYEQRNALLVGLAMGIALFPTLFSIVEDAIFAVPRSLSDGCLALGATRWQSMACIVLPAASPAILSALMIGLARGLGETMIVLLATGNTPIMEASAFNGLRSLSASLAAELPEAAVGGVQFRVLFFASLVLFALTFVLNTVAELFRQRLRYRYAGR